MLNEAQIEKLFTALISGDRPVARAVVAQAHTSLGSPEAVLEQLIWPTLENIQRLHRADQVSDLAHNFATRLMRQIVDHIGANLKQQPRLGKSVLVVSGNEQSEELAAQMSADLLEAGGYEVYYLGGGVASDEIVAQLGNLEADVLVVFGAVNSTVPQTRLLIDHLHDIGVCPRLQIVVGGGIFNRADGLSEEIGADAWAATPAELLDVLNTESDRRMTADQRTVGRRRRTPAGSGSGKRDAAAA
jgi:methanogenic corrinoid protein MtbC1